MTESRSAETPASPGGGGSRPARRRLGLLLLLVAVLMASLWWRIEWIEVEVRGGPSEAALADPFLAARQYLQAQGVTIESRQHFRDLDPGGWLDTLSTDAVIVLVDSYGVISEERSSRLLEWVSRGGHLVVSARSPFRGAAASGETSQLSDPLFKAFAVSLEASGQTEMTDADWRQLQDFSQLVGFTADKACELMATQVLIEFEDDGHAGAVDVNFLRPEILVANGPPPSAAAGGDWPRLLQFEEGEGLVTFVTSLEPWKNYAIGCLDHAWFLQSLAPVGGPLVLFHDQDRTPPWADWGARFPELWLLVILWMLVWLWWRGGRFGPLQPAADAVAGSRQAHYQACGDFLWDQAGGQALIEWQRQQLRPQLQRAGICDAEGRPLELERVAQRLGLSPAALREALEGALGDDPLDFVRIQQILQQLGNLT